MATTFTRTMLVVVSALTLALGAVGVTGGIGPDWATTEVSAATGGDGTGGDDTSG